MTTLLVASTGGHLKQLHHLHRRLSHVGGPFRWATFDTPQSQSLLDGEIVDFVPFVGGRDPVNVIRNLTSARRILHKSDIDTVVSTGSSVALPFFGLARAMGLACHYIESAARSEGPSVTGRLIQKIPAVHLYSQYPAWASERWAYGGSVFDSFEAAPPGPMRSGVEKVVVTLGTYRGYSFTRLVRRLLAIIPSEVDVLWQTGDTDTAGLDIDSHYAIPEHDLTTAMREADVVVAHAGVGTVLAALEVGKSPLLVPRRVHLGEHVDDHQTQIASELRRRRLAGSLDASDLEYSDLLAIANIRVTSVPEAPVFVTSDS